MKLILRILSQKIIPQITIQCFIFLNKCEIVFFAYKLGRREYVV